MRSLTSKSVVFDTYGDAGVLHTIEGEPAEPGPGHVRVRVRAAGVQPFDCLFRSGAAQRWMPASFPQRLGNDFAGVVDALGEGVKEFAAGDEVLGWATLASYAEHVVVAVTDIVAKPSEMPWEQAGGVSASGQTAATALRQLSVGAGDTVLIHAAAGGVGSFAVQIAQSLGATVIGTARQSNHEYLRALGAIPVAYGSGLADRVRTVAPRGVDAALDAVGTEEALRVSLHAVAEKSRVGTIAFSPLAAELGIRRLSTERSAAQLAGLLELYAAEQLDIAIQESFPLENAADAHRAVETRHVRGKIVLRA